MTARVWRKWGGPAPPWAGAGMLIAAWLAATGPAAAQAAGDVTPLGRSAASGAVCQAVRDYDDPLAQKPAARAWSIRCLGWDVPIGRLYRLPATETADAWDRSVAARAACQPSQAQRLQGFSQAVRRLCRNTELNAPYVAYRAHRGRFIVAAEGFAQVADVLETGLKVTGGVMAAPAAAQSQSSRAAAAVAADFGGEMAGLSSAQKAADGDAGRLIARGYVQNSEWRFTEAEADFRALAAAVQARHAPPADQALAMLNLALNISDTGRFAEADDLFAAADPLLAAAGDQALAAEALTYRAYHLRNQRRFTEAAAMAEKALAARDLARRAVSVTAVTVQRRSDDKTIDPTLAEALNSHPGAGSALSLSEIGPAVRLAVQDAESLEVEGSSKLAAKDPMGALAALDQARARLAFAEGQGAETVKLRARVEADVSDVDMAAGRTAAAADRYALALKLLRTRHAGSAPVGGLLLDLGRAQIATGRIEAALASYGEAFAVLKGARGSLGGSADKAEPYLDLLLDLAKKDPARAPDYAARFFLASEAVVGDVTAATISRLAARVASGDEATAVLVRAVDDARRDRAAAESQIADLQARNLYSGDAKAQADTRLQQVRDQLTAVNAALLSANPRYDQLVSSEVTLRDLQRALQPDEVYLKTLLLHDRGYGMLVGPGMAIPYAIPKARTEVVAAAETLRAPMDGADEDLAPFDVAGAQALFQTLFGPVSEPLLGARHLIYEPDGALVSLPVGVFVTDQASVDLVKARRADKSASLDYRGVAWLGAKLDSSLVLSAATFLQARKFQPSHARRLALSFADPALAQTDSRAYASLLTQGVERLARGGDATRATRVCQASRRALLQLAPLPETSREARVVAASLGAPESDVVTGQAFNDASIRARKDLSDYKILYFATHAILPIPDACLPEPALVTSLGRGDSDGLLDASEIVDLKLDADLVVLSACDTGGGAKDSGVGLSGGGEALGGLTRAFIYAGARGLIVSHWSVDSAATEQLMTDLFRSGDPSEASGLKRSQARMQNDPKLSHPYYWGPFTLIGDGSRPIPSGDPTVNAGARAAPPKSL